MVTGGVVEVDDLLDVPEAYRTQLGDVVVTSEQIREKVAELGAEITRDYADNEPLKGSDKADLRICGKWLLPETPSTTRSSCLARWSRRSPGCMQRA